MSGAAVWGNQRLIGVVGQHYPREGPGTLTVRPVEQLFRHASGAQLADWRAALPALPAMAEDLWLTAPPTGWNIEVARARRAAEALAPPVLVGRNAELASLDDFVGSGLQWRWIQADAFAGKTALLAWFALHPPGHVDVAACFLRRTAGANSADYALDVLTRQLALLAEQRGYSPPQYLPERVEDLADLLEEAARACAERGRRLLVLIDGLDEYDPMTTSFDLADWMPGANTLPEQAMLVVASRAGADVHLLPEHPLLGYVQRITTSEAATEIRHAARAELQRALTPPGGFTFPLIGCLAVAGSGLTASELCALLKRRGRDADVGEIEVLLGSSLGRSLMRLPDADDVDPARPEAEGRQVYVFAHDTLLTEARAILAADLTTYEDLLDEWADEYARRDWPIDTPRYLLRPHTRELARRVSDPATPSSRCRMAVDQLFMVVAHHLRSLRLFERTGNPAVPDQEIVAAQHAVADTRDRSGLDTDEVIFRLAVLGLRRRPLTDGKARIAAGIATVWARIGRVNAAIDLAVGIDVPEQRAPALSGVAVALAEVGQAEQAADVARQALQTAADIADPAQRVEALNGVVAALAGAGQAEQAADVARQALQTAVGIAVSWRRAAALNGVAVALAEAGQAEEALQAAVSIEDPGHQAWALCWVTAALAGAGQAKQAAAVAGQALQAAIGGTDPEQRAKALSRAAVALARAGQTQQAAYVAGQALHAAADIDDPWRRAATLSEMAVALAGAGQAEQALQAATDADDPKQQAEALSEAAIALAGDGQAADVVGQVLQAVTDTAIPWRRARVLSGVAVALAGAGQAEQAADAARLAMQATAGIADLGQRTAAVSGAAVALARAGQTEQATYVAEEAVQLALRIGAPWYRARALSRAAVVLAGAGQAEPGPAGRRRHRQPGAAGGGTERSGGGAGRSRAGRAGRRCG